MRYDVALQLPGAPADATRFFREAIAFAQQDAREAVALGADDVPAELLETDWQRLVPAGDERTEVDLDVKRYAKVRLTIRIEAVPPHSSAVRVAADVRFRRWLRFARLVPRRLYMRPVNSAIQQAQAEIDDAYQAWADGASPEAAFERIAERQKPQLPGNPEVVTEMAAPSGLSLPPATWMRWDEDTIAANRAGRLTAEQAHAVRRHVRRVAALAVLASTGIAGLVAAVVSASRNAVAIGAAGGGVLVALLAVARHRLGSLSDELKAGDCRVSEGRVSLSGDRRVRSLRVSGQSRRLLTQRAAGRLGVVNGAWYRVVWLPRSRLVVNAQPLPEPPPRAPMPVEVDARWRLVAADGRTVVDGHWHGHS